MAELAEGSGRHASKHRRKAAPLEVDGSEVKVVFGYPVLEATIGLSRAMARHYNLGNVDASATLDPEWKLDKLGDAKSLNEALAWLAKGCAEAGRCYGKTGDKKVLDALEEYLAALSGRSKTWGPDKVAILDVVPPSRGRNG